MKSLVEFINEANVSIDKQIENTLNKNTTGSITSLIKKLRANKHDFNEKTNYIVYLYDEHKSNPSIELYDLKNMLRYSITNATLYIGDNSDITEKDADNMVNNKTFNSNKIKYAYLQNEYGDKIVEIFKSKNIKGS